MSSPALKRIVSSNPTIVWWRVLLLVTSSLACNIQVPKKTDVANRSRASDHRPADTRQWPKENTIAYNAPEADDSELSTSYPPDSHPPPRPHRLPGNEEREAEPSQDPDRDGLRSSSFLVPYSSRHSGRTPGYDLSSLLAASSPGDLLNDAEINEFIHAEGMWAGGREAEREMKGLSAPVYKDGMVSRQMYRRFSGVIVYVAFPLTIVGFVTNVIALKVFRRLPKNVTNTYMTVLICFDMAYLLFVVCSRVVVIVIRAAWTSSSARRFLQLYVVYKFFILSARQVIIMTTAYMSLDRYFVIAFPFRTHSALFRRPRLLILMTALLILAFNSHKPLKREVKEGHFPGTNHTVYYLSYSQLYVDNHGLLDDLTIASSCLFQYCPLFAMLVANIALMTSLHRHSQRVSLPDVAMDTFMTSVQSSESSPACRRNHRTHYTDATGNTTLSRKDSSWKTPKMDSHFYQLERHLCVTVVAYSCLFFLLSLPLALLPILKKVFPEFNVFKSQHYLFLIYVRVFPLLHIISASVNFFVFFIKGGAFRAGVFRLLGCRRYDQRKRILRRRSMDSEGTADSHTDRVL